VNAKILQFLFIRLRRERAILRRLQIEESSRKRCELLSYNQPCWHVTGIAIWYRGKWARTRRQRTARQGFWPRSRCRRYLRYRANDLKEMPPKATWLLKIPEIVAMLESFDVPMVDRAIIERQFELRRRRTIELLNRLGGFRTGKGFPVDRRPDVGIDSSSPGRAASWRPPARLGKQARISNWPPMAFELYETVRSRRSRINICVVLMDLFGKQPIARPTKRRTLELVAACQ